MFTSSSSAGGLNDDFAPSLVNILVDKALSTDVYEEQVERAVWRWMQLIRVERRTCVGLRRRGVRARAGLATHSEKPAIALLRTHSSMHG